MSQSVIGRPGGEYTVDEWFDTEYPEGVEFIDVEEWVKCPYCHKEMRVFQHDDPLKKHLDYCELAPDGD